MEKLKESSNPRGKVLHILKNLMDSSRDGKRQLWRLAGFAIGCALGFLTAMLFYDNPVVFLAFFWMGPLFMWLADEKYSVRQRETLAIQFREGINGVAVALSAGYSVENSFVEAAREMRVLYGADSGIVLFLEGLKRQLRSNINIEDALMDYAVETGVEDIINFAEVFKYAKRSGGDMVEIIKNTISIIGSKMDTSREISVLISAKQMEQWIMDVAPMAIILYLRVTSPDMMDRLYGNLMGVMVMSAALVVYAAAVVLSIRITRIEV